MFLTRAEVAELTGAKLRRRQISVRLGVLSPQFRLLRPQLLDQPTPNAARDGGALQAIENGACTRGHRGLLGRGHGRDPGGGHSLDTSASSSLRSSPGNGRSRWMVMFTGAGGGASDGSRARSKSANGNSAVIE
jgi:hypothetical protein